jgi:hypothetical protein
MAYRSAIDRPAARVAPMYSLYWALLSLFRSKTARNCLSFYYGDSLRKAFLLSSSGRPSRHRLKSALSARPLSFSAADWISAFFLPTALKTSLASRLNSFSGQAARLLTWRTSRGSSQLSPLASNPLRMALPMISFSGEEGTSPRHQVVEGNEVEHREHSQQCGAPDDPHSILIKSMAGGWIRKNNLCQAVDTTRTTTTTSTSLTGAATTRTTTRPTGGGASTGASTRHTTATTTGTTT